MLSISILGVLLSNFTFIFVAWYPQYVVGGYWFLLLGPLVDGAVGGMLINFYILTSVIYGVSCRFKWR